MSEIISSIVSILIITWVFCSGFMLFVIATADYESREKLKEISKKTKNYYWWVALIISLGPISLIWSLFIKDSKDSKN